MFPLATLSPSDEQLARRAQRGCADSFDELIRRFQAPVLHFLQHRDAAAEAEDLLQETFVRAFTRLEQYRWPWRFSTWLFTIARRVSINHYRRTQGVSWPKGDAAAIRWAASAASGPAETAAREDSRRYLWARAAECLSEQQWTALWLHYVEDMPTRQVAAVLGCSRVAVKTMIHRARKKLLPLVQELGPDRPALAAAMAEVSHE
jgi:RNA polymerase sigma-70 factor (ECF subfamily)